MKQEKQKGNLMETGTNEREMHFSAYALAMSGEIPDPDKNLLARVDRLAIELAETEIICSEIRGEIRKCQLECEKRNGGHRNRHGLAYCEFCHAPLSFDFSKHPKPSG